MGISVHLAGLFANILDIWRWIQSCHMSGFGTHVFCERQPRQESITLEIFECGTKSVSLTLTELILARKRHSRCSSWGPPRRGRVCLCPVVADGERRSDGIPGCWGRWRTGRVGRHSSSRTRCCTVPEMDTYIINIYRECYKFVQILKNHNKRRNCFRLWEYDQREMEFFHMY